MTASRGLREAAQVNAAAAAHGDFTAMLLIALEDPEVAEAVADALRLVQARRMRRTSSVSVGSAGAARDLKAQRLANRERTRR